MPQTIRTFEGPGEILNATQAVLQEPDLQLVYISELVSTSCFKDMQTAHRNQRIEVLRAEVPLLPEAEAFAEEWWQENGYKDYDLCGGLEAEEAIPAGDSLGLHVDVRPGPAVIRALLTLSLGFGGSARWEGARPSPGFADRNGDFSRARLTAWRTRAFLARRSVETVSVVQKSRGGIIIPQHPTPAAHSVSASPHRSALLFGIRASRR